jgi:hypothetical protein
LNLLGIIFPELLLLPLLQLPELDARPLNHPPIDLDRKTALLQAPPALQLLSPHVIPLHVIVGVLITGDFGGDEGLRRDLLVEGSVDAGLLLRVVWAR